VIFHDNSIVFKLDFIFVELVAEGLNFRELLQLINKLDIKFNSHLHLSLPSNILVNLHSLTQLE
jgi:hypothetical protein